MISPKRLFLAAALVITISHCTRCTSTDEREKGKPRVRCKSVPEAVNHFHKLLAGQMDLEKKCKKYAVILSMTAVGGLLYETTIEQLSLLPDDIVYRHHQQMGQKKLGALFMSAVDKYRTSQLAPPLLDLIECLKKIDEPMVERYLNNEELKTILYLYQQALESPDKKIDLDKFDLSKFNQAFHTNLRNALRDHLKGETNIVSPEQSKSPTGAANTVLSLSDREPGTGTGLSAKPTPPSDPSQQQQSVALVRQKLNRSQRREQLRILRLLQAEQLLPPEPDLPEPAAAPAHVLLTDQPPLVRVRLGRPRVRDEQVLEERRKRKRMQERDRGRRRRQEDLVRYREKERLRQQRRRLMDPPKFTERGRDTQRKRRARQRIERRDRQLQQYELQQQQLRRLERQMQLQAQLQRIQELEQQQQTDQKGLFDQYLAPRQPPDLMWPEPVPKPAERGLLASHLSPQELIQRLKTQHQQEQLQLQHRLLSMPPEHVSIIDDIRLRPVNSPSLLNTSYPQLIPNLAANESQYHHQQQMQQAWLLRSLSTTHTPMPAVPEQIQSGQMQSGTERSVVKPTVRIYPQRLPPFGNSQFASSSIPHGQIGASSSQAGYGGRASIVHTSLSRQPQEQAHSAGGQVSAGGHVDDSDRQSVDVQTIMNQSYALGNVFGESNSSKS